MLALIKHLPVESLFYGQIRGGTEFHGWGPDRYLTASLIDAVQANTHAFISANSKRKVKRPDPVWRPDKAKKDPKSNTFAAMARRAHYANRK